MKATNLEPRPTTPLAKAAAGASESSLLGPDDTIPGDPIPEPRNVTEAMHADQFHDAQVVSVPLVGRSVVGADGVRRPSSLGAGGFERIQGDSEEWVQTDKEGQRVCVTGADKVARVVRVIRGR